MKRYVALLRGINVSGKNKVSMDRLKECLMTLGFSNVKTLLNSGNAAFDSDKNEKELEGLLEQSFLESFSFEIPVFVIEQGNLKELLEKAPSWWESDDKKYYDNLIFPLHSCDLKELSRKIGDASEGLEQVEVLDDAVFWTFIMGKHSKANWWKKTAAPGIGEHLTIRTAGTCRKLVNL